MMMKKILIILLFFGLSFGQDSKYIGNWKTQKTDLVDFQVGLILLKNKNFFWILDYFDSRETVNISGTWVISENDDGFNGKLLFIAGSEIISCNFMLVSKEFLKDDTVRETLQQFLKTPLESFDRDIFFIQWNSEGNFIPFIKE
tara:strand:- start:219 stop:650 length:432 start_codon:yes stop_codon:yes gene_type:complete